ncbi:hypothetical protein MGYG_05278 [Nannizzia gypsea CBS 118893]|uniref:Uncharacterized protein n=1 Tax=Arthroderma gypseum (strain ATCC MYA-4604 / CBS 118893) TaxID=535722 RepID=E4UVF1_ARTGP|nr:hypothetical protein MGYG_05278 [Nannizzia gypsea CBS 118893]EFR02278.1 hypothetical protein MGYG_05278 [Nannizzia gypsea CBS 118893]
MAATWPHVWTALATTSLVLIAGANLCFDRRRERILDRAAARENAVGEREERQMAELAELESLDHNMITSHNDEFFTDTIRTSYERTKEINKRFRSG